MISARYIIIVLCIVQLFGCSDNKSIESSKLTSFDEEYLEENDFDQKDQIRNPKKKQKLIDNDAFSSSEDLRKRVEHELLENFYAKQDQLNKNAFSSGIDSASFSFSYDTLDYQTETNTNKFLAVIGASLFSVVLVSITFMIRCYIANKTKATLSRVENHRSLYTSNRQQNTPESTPHDNTTSLDTRTCNENRITSISNPQYLHTASLAVPENVHENIIASPQFENEVRVFDIDNGSSGIRFIVLNNDTSLFTSRNSNADEDEASLDLLRLVALHHELDLPPRYNECVSDELPNYDEACKNSTIK